MTTSARQRQAAASVKSRPPRIADRLPAEGENGVFTESWFPLCKSSEIAPGEMRGIDFLDGRVVVMRDQQGEVHVLSACHATRISSGISWNAREAAVIVARLRVR